jgi:acetoin:2,6-dichlorophenolindophenol oxidoreductase subunit alpha
MTTNLPRDQLLELYRTMQVIRATEERLAEDCAAGKLPGPVHLYIGQEAIAVGLCAHLNDSDWIASTHRGHGHFLAKGGDVGSLMAEIHGRTTGMCKGYGGSMHVADFSKGIMGANGIVGGGIALMTGAALAAQLDGKGGVAVCFFGDGAANQGVLMEALNTSALWRLPLVLVCENNGFSEFSPSATVTAGEIYRRATPFNVATERVDGNDLLELWHAADRAVRRARAGEGPTLIEAMTYRIRGHVEYEGTFLSQPYRTEQEVESWRAKDPLKKFRDYLVGQGLAEGVALETMDRAVAELVKQAAEQAEAAPWPEATDSPARLMFA